MNDLDKHFRNELRLIKTLCALAVLAPFIALVPWLRYAGESPECWFMRSGAITSIFGGIAQFRINEFAQSIRGGTFAESWAYYKKFNDHQEVISRSVAFIAVLGAIIWGYGDIIARIFHL